MSRWKRISAIIDLVMSLGIVVISISLLVYMFVKDAFTFALFLSLLIFLYIGARNLVGTEQLRSVQKVFGRIRKRMSR